MAYAHCYLGQLLHAAGRDAEAATSLRRALEIFERLSEADAAPAYDLACIRSLCSMLVALGAVEPARRRSRRYADDAVATLRRAIAGGFRNVEQVEKDTDFDPVRGVFRALVRGLKEGPRVEATSPAR